MLLLSWFSVGIVTAQICPVGVVKDDVFVYYMFSEYVSTVSNASVDVPEFEANNTVWVSIEITDVNGSLVSQVYTLHYKNGTDQFISGLVDISNGTSYMQESGGSPRSSHVSRKPFRGRFTSDSPTHYKRDCCLEFPQRKPRSKSHFLDQQLGSWRCLF